MPDKRLERTRKLYDETVKQALDVKLPDTTKPYWWIEDQERALAETIKLRLKFW